MSYPLCSSVGLSGARSRQGVRAFSGPCATRGRTQHSVRYIRQKAAFTVRAEQGNGQGKTPRSEKTERIIESMRKQGMDKDTAQRIVKVWEDSGAKDPNALRRMFLKGTLLPLSGLLVQTLLDAGAAYGAYTAGLAIGANGDFFGKWAVEAVLFLLSGYFATGVFFDFFTLGAIGVSTLQFGTNTDAFIEAVRTIAGSDTGVAVVDKARKAVNTAKVVQALNNMSSILKERVSADAKPADTLSNLSVMMIMSAAADRYGFKASNYGLTDAQAVDIARVFARYDINDDFRLEFSEFRKLCTDLGKVLDDDESREAMKILDKRGSGFVEFDEFVSWWTGGVKEESAPVLSEATKSSAER